MTAGGVVRAGLKWTVTALTIVMLVTMPFVLWEGEVLELAARLFEARAGAVLALAILALFAGDVFLPIPSSLVSVAAVALFGWAGGLLIWSGMTASCALGYWFGRRAARPFALGYLGPAELEKARRLAASVGPATLVLTRAVPVLAEAATIGAGLAVMPFGRFMRVTALANAGIALVYVAASAVAGSEGSFPLLFAAAILVPALGWIAHRFFARLRPA
jgi:3-dehydroquinate synthase